MKIFELFNKHLTDPRAIRHHALNWHATEIAAKHPQLPVGWILRDQGQADIFAGKSKLVMAVNGDTLRLAVRYQLQSEKISFISSGIENFRILGKHFNKEIFDGKPVPVAKVPASTIKESCFFMSPAGTPVPFTDFFDLAEVFRTPPEPVTQELEMFNCVNKALKGQDYGCF